MNRKVIFAGCLSIFAAGGLLSFNLVKNAGIQGPDGSLYVSDDSKGTIYKISYKK